MTLNASLDAALKGAAPLVCLLLKVELPARTLRLADGAGQVVYGGEAYSGEDAVYGVLNSIDPTTDGAATEAPALRFSFLPTSLASLAEITSPSNQGAPVYLWLAAVDPETGLLIGEPELLFFGELDTADVETTSDRTLITFDVVSGWERLFDASEGQRLNNSFHQSVWPGERGFEFVTQIQREEPWGYAGVRPAVVADTNGGAPGAGSSPPPTGGGRFNKPDRPEYAL